MLVKKLNTKDTKKAEPHGSAIVKERTICMICKLTQFILISVLYGILCFQSRGYWDFGCMVGDMIVAGAMVFLYHGVKKSLREDKKEREEFNIH